MGGERKTLAVSLINWFEHCSLIKMAVLLMNEQEFSKKFAVAIMRWRRRLNMTAKEFGDFVGASENTIYNYENGRCMPQLYTAIMIAEKLGISVDDLLRGD